MFYAQSNLSSNQDKTLLETINEKTKNYSAVLNRKTREDQAYDGDTESNSSSTQSYYSSSQNTITNEKEKYCIEKSDTRIFKSRHSYEDISQAISTNIWIPSQIMTVPLTQEIKIIPENSSQDIPKLPRRSYYDFSLESSTAQAELYPEERLKTLLAAILTFLGFIATLTSLVLTHQRLPDRNTYGPLPDIVLDNLLPFDWALDLSEYIIVWSINSILLILLFHRHRFIVFRRLFLIMAVLYLYRAITMYITVLPIASKTYHCDPKMINFTFMEVVKRVLKLLSGFGLSINGKHVYCGDYIYSGHTVTLILSYLTVTQYTSQKFWFVHWIYWFLAALGIIFLQFAHGHYTIDIIIAYYVTTRIFWNYHTLANNQELKQNSANNYYSREWWFIFFQFFEKNVGGKVPNDYDWPFSWPKKWDEEEQQ